jgi:hypothetical protein
VTPAKNLWARLAVEGIFIVGSILLAFWIDAWWDATQAHDREERGLIALQGEFALVHDAVASGMSAREWSAHRTAALIRQVRESHLAPADSLYLWMTGPSVNIEFSPPQAVLGDLTSQGATRILGSDSLRFAVARYRAKLVELSFADAQARATWEQRLQPYLEGKVPRMSRNPGG